MDRRRQWLVAFLAVWAACTLAALWGVLRPTKRPPTIEERLERIESKLHKIDEYLSHP